MPETVAQVITGVMPPELGEARIREAWPSVASKPALASLGRRWGGAAAAKGCIIIYRSQ